MPPTAAFDQQQGVATISAGGFLSPATKGKDGLRASAGEFTPSKASRGRGDGSSRAPFNGCLEEVAFAGQWWSKSMKTHGLSQGQVNAFETALINGMSKRCDGHWYPSEPMRGSGHRSVLCDITVDPVLTEAGARASIKDVGARLPKAVMWINPGVVRVQADQERHACTLFSSANTPNKGSGSSSGSDTD